MHRFRLFVIPCSVLLKHNNEISCGLILFVLYYFDCYGVFYKKKKKNVEKYNIIIQRCFKILNIFFRSAVESYTPAFTSSLLKIMDANR